MLRATAPFSFREFSEVARERVLPGGQRDDALDGSDDLGHAADMPGRDEGH